MRSCTRRRTPRRAAAQARVEGDVALGVAKRRNFPLKIWNFWPRCPRSSSGAGRDDAPGHPRRRAWRCRAAAAVPRLLRRPPPPPPPRCPRRRMNAASPSGSSSARARSAAAAAAPAAAAAAPAAAPAASAEEEEAVVKAGGRRRRAGAFRSARLAGRRRPRKQRNVSLTAGQIQRVMTALTDGGVLTDPAQIDRAQQALAPLVTRVRRSPRERKRSRPPPLPPPRPQALMPPPPAAAPAAAPPARAAAPPPPPSAEAAPRRRRASRNCAPRFCGGAAPACWDLACALSECRAADRFAAWAPPEPAAAEAPEEGDAMQAGDGDGDDADDDAADDADDAAAAPAAAAPAAAAADDDDDETLTAAQVDARWEELRDPHAYEPLLARAARLPAEPPLCLPPLGRGLSLGGALARHRLDPSKQLCRFELRGECRDAACTAQHRRDYLQGTAALRRLPERHLRPPDADADGAAAADGPRSDASSAAAAARPAHPSAPRDLVLRRRRRPTPTRARTATRLADSAQALVEEDGNGAPATD